MMAAPSPECPVMAYYAADYITDDHGDYVVILVEQDVPGYVETTYTGSLEYVAKIAERYNVGLGYKAPTLTNPAVLDVVASTMGGPA